PGAPTPANVFFFYTPPRLRTHWGAPLLSYTPFYISYGKMQAIHGVTVVYARNSFIAFIAALLAILRVSERSDATGSKKPSCSFSTVHRQPSTLF
ncbi:hypothetical protein ACW9VS_08835, partial [Bifidobacterium adolescentis]